jgi:hypothetical protein
MPRRLVACFALLLTCCALPVPRSARAVNLVPNPDFECYASCPTSFGQIAQASPWDTPNTGTSDYMNACAPVAFPSLNVPQNQQGFQTAHSGVGYAGLIPFSAAPDYREYIEAPLTSPLTANVSYVVQFYVSLADSSSLAIDRMGAYLSIGQVGPIGNYAAIPVTPQVESPANVHLTNAAGWTLVSGVIMAAGGEDHITIGNFHDDASTSTVPGPGTWPGGAYYYIDDVSVQPAAVTLQACCMADNSCSMQFPGECTAMGGSPAGPGTTCTPNPCVATRARPATWGAIQSIYR